MVVYHIYLFLWPHSMGLVPQPGIKPMPPALEAWRLNHWTSGEVPCSANLKIQAVGRKKPMRDLRRIRRIGGEAKGERVSRRKEQVAQKRQCGATTTQGQKPGTLFGNYELPATLMRRV